jgi:hypothetical protein
MNQIQEVVEAFDSYYDETSEVEAKDLADTGRDFLARIEAFGTQNPELKNVAGMSFQSFYSEFMRRNDKGRYAELVGMKTNQLFNISKGYSRPSLAMQQKLSKAAQELFGIRVYFPGDTE